MFSSSGTLMLTLDILVQQLWDVCMVCLGSSVDRGAKAVEAVAWQGNGSVRPVSSAVPWGSRPGTARHLLHSRRRRKGKLVILNTNILSVLNKITQRLIINPSWIIDEYIRPCCFPADGTTDIFVKGFEFTSCMTEQSAHLRICNA